jgi:hypothetical protein
MLSLVTVSKTCCAVTLANEKSVTPYCAMFCVLVVALGLLGFCLLAKLVDQKIGGSLTWVRQSTVP